MPSDQWVLWFIYGDERRYAPLAMSKDATEVQLHGLGPWKIVYVNPEDDPMRKVAKSN